MVNIPHLATKLVALALCTSVFIGQAKAKDIVDTAVEAGSFKTLAAALQAADLVEALKSEGPFTVFAPTDKAFAKLPEGTVETLLKPENKQQLVGILTYHVVKGEVPAAKVVELSEAKTLNGKKVSIKVNDGTVLVNDAKVVKTDISCDNGIIHVIDSVLLPPDKQSSTNPRRMIESAIAKGAPMYNEGHPSACADVYMNTAQELLSMEDHGMSASTMQTLQTALRTSQHTSCSDTQAWTMRRALDMAYRDVR